MSASDAQTIIRLSEEKIRIKTIAAGLRVTEFFHDFDRLRSGYVTASQFKRYLLEKFSIIFAIFCLFRCLDTNLRLELSPEEEELLFKKYDLKHDGTICYREFCDVINRSKNGVSTSVAGILEQNSIRNETVVSVNIGKFLSIISKLFYCLLIQSCRD